MDAANPIRLKTDGLGRIEIVRAGMVANCCAATSSARRCSRRGYYRDALRLLARLHRRGIVHNDLAKEPNWLVRADGHPALVDFHLAWTRGRRGRLFRLLAREDLRHLLKHKRTYGVEALSARQRTILDMPAAHSRLWRATGKRLYKLVARRVFGYRDNEGRARVRD